MLLWFGCYEAACYFFERIRINEIFGFHDWYIFVAHAKQFLSTGILYERDLTLYAPSAPIYKFPPLFDAILIFFFNMGFSQEKIRYGALFIHFFLYFLSAFICLQYFRGKNYYFLLPLTAITALTFEPFFDNYTSAQMEIYILFLLTLSFFTLAKNRIFISGLFIGIAAAIKIYPIYFAGYYFARKKYSGLAGIMAGFAIVTVFSLLITGASEHLFYFTNILPILLTEDISGRGENISITRLFITLGASASITNIACDVLLALPIIILLYQSRKQTGKPLTETQQATFNLVWFAIFITTLLLTMKNSWWNYQILLLIPLIVCLGLSINNRRFRISSLAVIVFSNLIIFWCNLGKLDVFIMYAGKMLDASALLTHIMLQTGFLRGLATFLILILLVIKLQTSNCGDYKRLSH